MINKLMFPAQWFMTGFSVLALGLAATSPGRAATVWDGPITTFSETSTDSTLPSNQDRMTPNVWITRGGLQGIFNAKTEPAFTHFSSPADTAWADGTIANYASLSYTDWNSWAKLSHGGPPSTVGIDVVVHLISDDIYLGLKFTSWGQAAGLFSYQRTTPHVEVSPIRLNITQIPGQVVLTWTNAAFSLQSASAVSGPYTTITNAVSPFTTNISGAQTYFRLVH